ncbi:succinylglutamate desuccinylase/aspartoacylase family protein [Marinobacter salinisoli]|uniref:Succinylglutamate desuccinylase/aspartoacylase family protein n=2 Tax=Marinobacter salinisoli TaxID=2769486 RepID=A0ABX7MYD2_9GAMM|nr:succinylglutamate desuccinylase/aspartoacylase family protein [Marinobacter salinisoli]
MPAQALATLNPETEEQDRRASVINELEEDESVDEVEHSTQRGAPNTGTTPANAAAQPDIGILPSGQTQPSAPDTPVAANVDLNDVVTAPESELLAMQLDTLPMPRPAQPLALLGSEVLPGTSARLAWSPGIQIPGLSQPTPVLAVNGIHAGPTLCLTGAVHGDELNGIEIVRRTIYDLNAEELSGRVIGVPIVNLPGFQQGSRYLPDRRDLNRHFPGSPDGSLADRIAHSLFENVIRHCDMLVDIHTGSLKRTNLPQLRADMNNPDVATFTQGFDRMAVVHSSGSPGMLRSAAVAAGIVAVTLEAGESHRIQEHQIEAGVNSLTSLMEKQGMTSRMFVWGDPEPVYYDSDWIRAQHGGILFSEVDLGAHVSEGEILGYVADPITNAQYPIRANSNGRVIGMAVDQVVMAGFAAYHIGTEAEIPAE